MQDLHSLLHSFTYGEWASFQSYLTSFTAHDQGKLKYLQLAKILMNSETAPSHDACCISIYGAKNVHSFNELKSSFREKALDFLLTDISADKQKELDEADYAVIKIKKKSAQFQQLFYSKKRIPLLYPLLDEIIFLSKEYERYSLLVEHLRIKRNSIGWKKGEKEFAKINKEMENYEACSRMVNKAEYYYYELMMKSDPSGKQSDQKLKSFFEKATVELDAYYEQTKSALIKYHNEFLKLGYSIHVKNYLKARSICLKLLEVVRNNKSVYRRQRIGVVYDNLSRCDFYLGNFEQAAEFATEAQKHFKLNSENYCIALEQEFYALFAMNNYEKAVDIANKMISNAPSKELGEFRFSKYNYLLANALFKQRRFNEVLDLLSQNRELSKDKTGWEVGARTLTIMTLIEMLKLDEAGLAVHSLKQFYKRLDSKIINISETNSPDGEIAASENEKETSIRSRDKKILNLLLIAERAGFMFSTLNGNTNKYAKALASEFPWEPFTHELIPFHEWFAKKMKNKIGIESFNESKKKGEKIRVMKSKRKKKASLVQLS